MGTEAPAVETKPVVVVKEIGEEVVTVAAIGAPFICITTASVDVIVDVVIIPPPSSLLNHSAKNSAIGTNVDNNVINAQ